MHQESHSNQKSTLQKKILITGIAGFIGYHLAKSLQQASHTIIGIDNFNDYYEVTLKRDRAKQLQNQHIKVIEGDVCDQSLLEQIINE